MNHNTLYFYTSSYSIDFFYKNGYNYREKVKEGQTFLTLST